MHIILSINISDKWISRYLELLDQRWTVSIDFTFAVVNVVIAVVSESDTMSACELERRKFVLRTNLEDNTRTHFFYYTWFF